MNEAVLRRFVYLMVLMLVVAFVGSDVLRSCVNRPAGDYETQLGSQRLEDGLYDEARSLFDQALAAQPDHRGALMGKALVSMRQQNWAVAIAQLDYLIDFLTGNLNPDDATGRGVLAAAYANRGIAHDHLANYEKALADYIRSLETDQETVSGPGVIHKILYGPDHVSTVRDRARYIHEQLQLPESERVMRIPALDDRQRMYKP